MKQTPEYFIPGSDELMCRDYTENNWWETLLSYKDPEKDTLIRLLQKASEYAYQKEITKVKVLITRELRMYGTAVVMTVIDSVRFQNHGFGMV